MWNERQYAIGVYSTIPHILLSYAQTAAFCNGTGTAAEFTGIIKHCNTTIGSLLRRLLHVLELHTITDNGRFALHFRNRNVAVTGRSTVRK